MKANEQFFYDHAGYSWNPAIETQEEGHYNCAVDLAKAESLGSDEGLSFEWSIDDLTSAEWSDDPDPYEQWVCVCRSVEGEVLSSLCGIDFGRDGSPRSDPYRRVIEAELALEVLEIA